MPHEVSLSPDPVEVPPEIAYEAANEQLARVTEALVLARAGVRYLSMQLHDTRVMLADARRELLDFQEENRDQEKGVGDGPKDSGNTGDGRSGDRPEDVPQ